MQKFKVKTKFTVGDTVGCPITRRHGTVIKVYEKLGKIGPLEYAAYISYSVQPEVKSHNNFRLIENEAREVLYDEDGTANFIVD